MTTLRVLIDDPTLAALQAEGDATRKPPEEIAARRLATAIKLLPAGGRAVALHGDTLNTLETILGSGSILNQQDLLQKVERLAGVSFFHVRLPFTPNQLEALVEKATRQGLTVDQLVERTAPRVYEQFFDLMVRS